MDEDEMAFYVGCVSALSRVIELVKGKEYSIS
jgi:hypothetical protein